MSNIQDVTTNNSELPFDVIKIIFGYIPTSEQTIDFFKINKYYSDSNFSKIFCKNYRCDYSDNFFRFTENSRKNVRILVNIHNPSNLHRFPNVEKLFFDECDIISNKRKKGYLTKWTENNSLKKLNLGGWSHFPGDFTPFNSLKKLNLGFYDGKIGYLVFPDCLEELTFGRNFNRCISRLIFPNFLKKLTFGWRFDKCINSVKFPDSLIKITFGYYFNRDVESVRFPKSLKSLTFGDRFNMPVEKMQLFFPLKKLVFGEMFNKPIDNLILSGKLEGLQKFRIQGINAYIKNLGCLTYLKKIHISTFYCKEIDFSKLIFVKKLVLFGDLYGNPVDEIIFPQSLKKLHLVSNYRSIFDNISFPDNLEELRICYPITCRFTFPDNIKKMVISSKREIIPFYFKFPKFLEELHIEGNFRGGIINLELPEYLISLSFDYPFNQPVNNLKLPGNLKKLSFGDSFDHSLNDLKIPESLELLSVGACFDKPINILIDNLKSKDKKNIPTI